MKLITKLTNLEKMKSTDTAVCECYHCKNMFNLSVKYIRATLKGHVKHISKFCSSRCHYDSKKTKILMPCKQCNQLTLKQKDIATNVFCSRSCAATYNNLHKTKGNRRSKLEAWLEEKLNVLYPDLVIEYCNKAAINGELDIYVPSLQLAFELNGIYHYEPIHGQGKLDQVQSNDHRKFQACIEHGIELVIMDTSQLKYFKEANCIPYLDIIRKIVDGKL